MENQDGPPPVPLTDEVLRLLVVTSGAAATAPAVFADNVDPQPGDLVVEVSHQSRRIDPDAIGWLIGHDQAPYRDDGTGPMREVWDVVPLSGRLPDGRSCQRWENAEFRRVPKSLIERAGMPAWPVAAET